MGTRADARKASNATKGLTVGDFARRVFSTPADELVANGDALRQGDVEAVHRSRVALRRFRGSLRVFDFIDRAPLAALDADVARFARILGRVRDLDVLIPEPTALADASELLDPTLVSALVERARRDHDDASRQFRRHLDGELGATIIERLLAAAATPPLRSGVDAATRARREVRRCTRQALRSTAERAIDLGRRPSLSQQHELRKRVKRARYAATSLAELSGRSDDQHLTKELARVQDLLGRTQDRATLHAWLLALADGPSERRLGFAAGVLAATVRGDTAHVTRDWHAARKALQRLA